MVWIICDNIVKIKSLKARHNALEIPTVEQFQIIFTDKNWRIHFNLFPANSNSCHCNLKITMIIGVDGSKPNNKLGFDNIIWCLLFSIFELLVKMVWCWPLPYVFYLLIWVIFTFLFLDLQISMWASMYNQDIHLTEYILEAFSICPL